MFGTIANDEMTCEFSNLGIQCVKKKDIEDSLRVREEIRVDPFRSEFVVEINYYTCCLIIILNYI